MQKLTLGIRPAFLLVGFLQGTKQKMKYAGEVYIVPPDDLLGGDPKDRPHVLLNDCEDADAKGILAYCSTVSTEARHNAISHLVDPVKAGSRMSGFDVPTYVYPSRLVAIETEDLVQKVGRLMDDMVAVRGKFADALGLGTGTGAGSGFARGSMRGQVVTLQDTLAEVLETEYAVVVTEPLYCREHRYQSVVPIYPGAKFEALPDDVFADAAWVERVEPGYGPGVLAVEWVQSVYQPTRFKRLTGVVVDDQTIQLIDAALKLHFDL